jgi:hypothetical protein
MKTLFKLIVAALVLNASVRGALAMWQYYQFKDGAQQAVLFGQRSDPEEIHANIMARATALGVSMKPEDIKISRDSTRTTAQGSYVQTVQFFPNYPYPVKFTFLVDAVSLGEPLGSGRK